MKKIFFLGLVLFFGILVAYFHRFQAREAYLNFQKSRLPKEISVPQVSAMSRVDEINLDIPFSSQAPLKNWGMPFQEACEETTVLLVDAFYRGRQRNAAEWQEEIVKLTEWEKKNFGFYKHTAASDTARILKEYFGYANVEVRYDFSVEDVRDELLAGRPVILPLAGRHIENPFYHRPGPVYHMLVVKGFTKDGRFITNDVGTQYGENYAYDASILFGAVHDALSSGDNAVTDEEILRGRRAMIVVKL